VHRPRFRAAMSVEGSSATSRRCPRVVGSALGRRTLKRAAARGWSVALADVHRASANRPSLCHERRSDLPFKKKPANAAVPPRTPTPKQPDIGPDLPDPRAFSSATKTSSRKQCGNGLDRSGPACVRHGLSAGGRRIRTRGPSAKGKAVGSHSRQALPSRA
jgi:hypothetical protein